MYFSFKLKHLRTLYNIATHLAGFHLKVIGLFSKKLMLGVKGRAETFKLLKSNIEPSDKVIWLHCASLGEYEQGLPVFEAIKSHYQQHNVLLSFFSPSGYEIKKNSPIADLVVYLPLDTKINAKTFLNLTHPDLVIFVKYEIWPNYLTELKRRNIKSILISAAFRKDQSLFKAQGKWIKKTLSAFEHIFVQNKNSEEILDSKGITNVTVSGDTRFDRVSNQILQNNDVPGIKEFKDNKLCIVAGSTWPDGEKYFVDFINKDTSDTKYIIVPHNIKLNKIKDMQSLIASPSILYSEFKDRNLKDYKVLIIDSIGLLSKVYHFADLAYVGGAIGNTGLHNTLEAAVFGIPIIIGNNHKKFPEALEMITRGGMYSVNRQEDFNQILHKLITNKEERVQSGALNAHYVTENKGAVIQILNYLRI
jgi:3-deoxy-D-manno-octulosonic-acid transferase